MRNVKILSATVSAAIALAMVMVVTPGASAAPAPQPRPAAPSSGSSSSIQSFSTEAAAEKFWTPARMAVARPAAAKVDLTRASAGVTADIAPVLSHVRTDIPAIAGSLGAAPGVLQDPMIRPYNSRVERLNGKVFFTQDGDDYVCSGTVVNSESKDLIDTAGHCVNDGYGRWSTNVVFVPGYNSANAAPYPFGIWSAQRLTTTWEWFMNGNFKQDLGYIVLQPLKGRAIVNHLGGQGSYFNVTRDQTMNAFGYPQAAPFNGTQQRYALSATASGAGDNPWSGWAGPNTLRINSKMTPGSSGGGWIVGVSKTTGLGHVNGHNDYRYISGPKVNSGHMYSPYYGAEALDLYNFTRTLQ